MKDKVYDVHQTIDAVVNVKLEEALKEEADKARKRTNIMIHNLPESEATDEEERKRYDKEECLKVFRDHLGVVADQNDIVHVLRMGKRNDAAVKPRLLRVILSSIEKKSNILTNAPKLKKSGNQSIKKLYITPDMTPKEMEEDTKIRKELTRRRAEGENDLMIRRGKIVRRPEAMAQGGLEEHAASGGAEADDATGHQQPKN